MTNKIQTIRSNAEIVASQHAILNAAVDDAHAAALELLEVVWQAVKPAAEALSSRILMAKSGPGCRRHGYPKGTQIYSPRRGLLVLPSVTLGVDGQWWIDVAGNQTCADRCCAVYDWERISQEELLRAVPVSQLVDGLSEVVAEQMTRGQAKRVPQFKAQARKLRALADLLVTETRE